LISRRENKSKGIKEYFPLLMSRRGNYESSQRGRNGRIFAPVDLQERNSAQRVRNVGNIYPS
jgi:hypothetical protein